MKQDPGGFYKERLREEPFLIQGRVNSPWHQSPSLHSYNRPIFDRIQQLIGRMDQLCRNGNTPPSRGVLVQGEAGMGKTHLLMRLTQSFADTHHMIFIRKPNNEDAVARHVWSNMLESLTRPTPSAPWPGWSQFDAMLSHVLTKVLLLELNNDLQHGKGTPATQQWISLLEQTPDNLHRALGTGQNRTRNVLLLRRRAMDYLCAQHDQLERDIVGALLYYFFLEDQQQKRHLLLWLQGQDLAPEHAEALRVPESWIEIAPEATMAGILNAKEGLALRAIYSIGILSTYYHPLLVAFDQLEGLRNDRALTRRWGDVMREIFSLAPNMLVLTCIFPSLWDSWFQEQLDGSTTDRIAEYEYTLEALNENHAFDLLTSHLEPLCLQVGADSPFPFEREDVTALYTKGLTPRRFLKKARERFEDWLDEDDIEEVYSPTISKSSAQPTEKANDGLLPPVLFVDAAPKKPEAPKPLVPEPKLPTLEERLDTTISRRLRALEVERCAAFTTEQPNEEELLGRIRTLTRFFLRHLGEPLIEEGAQKYRRVVPEHFTLKPSAANTAQAYEQKLTCIAVCNKFGVAFTNRVRNICGPFPRLLLLRDSRCKKPGKSAQHMLRLMNESGGQFITIDQSEFGQLSAVDEIITEIQEQDLALDDETAIEERALFTYLQHAEFMFQSQALKYLYEALADSVQHPAKIVKEIQSATLSVSSAPVAPMVTPKAEGPVEAGQTQTKPKLDAAQAKASRIEAEAPEAPALVVSPPPPPLTAELPTFPVNLRPTHASRMLRLPPGPKIYLEQASAAVIEERDDLTVKALYARTKSEMVEPTLLGEVAMLYQRPHTDTMRATLQSLLQACHSGEGSRHKLSAHLKSTRAFREVWDTSWGSLWAMPGTDERSAICSQVFAALHDPTERVLLLSCSKQDSQVLAAAIDKVLLGSNLTVARASTENMSTLSLKEPARVICSTISHAIHALCQPELLALVEQAGKAPFTTVFVCGAEAASRATTALLGLLASRRFLLVGDPMRSASISEGARILPSHQARWCTESALGHLHQGPPEEGVQALLHSQSRMEPGICALASNYGYHGRLTTIESRPHQDYQRSAGIRREPQAIWYVLDHDPKIQYQPMRCLARQSWQRPGTFDLLDRLLLHHREWKDCSCLFLSPYRAQVDLANDWLQGHDLPLWSASTIQTSQQITADLVIIDTVRAGSREWTDTQWRRLLTTALCRANHELLLFASSQELRSPCMQPLVDHIAPRIFQPDAAPAWKSVACPPGPELPTQRSNKPALIGAQLTERSGAPLLLTAAQVQLADVLAREEPHLAIGGAGSGKTITLAYSACVFAASAASNAVLWIVVTNRLVERFLRPLIGFLWKQELSLQAPFPWERVELQYLPELLQHMADINGLDDFSEDDSALPVEHVAHELSQLGKYDPATPTCDALLIDEAQDFGLVTLRLLSTLVKQQKPCDVHSKKILFFHDSYRNMSQHSAASWESLGVRKPAQTSWLPDDFRSTKQIAEFALNVYFSANDGRLRGSGEVQKHPGLHRLIQSKSIEQVSRVDEQWWSYRAARINGPSPTIHWYQKLREQMEALADRVIDLLEKEQVRPQDIRIIYTNLVCKNALARNVNPKLQERGFSLEFQKEESFAAGPKVVVASEPGLSKGFEAEIVMIAGVNLFVVKEEDTHEVQWEALCSSMLCARSMLMIYGTKREEVKARHDLYQVLERCIAQLSAPGVESLSSGHGPIHDRV